MSFLSAHDLLKDPRKEVIKAYLNEVYIAASVLASVASYHYLGARTTFASLGGWLACSTVIVLVRLHKLRVRKAEKVQVKL